MGTPPEANPLPEHAEHAAPTAEPPAAPPPPVPPPPTPPVPNALRSGRPPRSRRETLTGKPTPASAIRPADPVDMLRFMFAVGIECSCPVVEAGRVDQLRDTGHYELWQTDLKLVRELGLRYLRYGPPIYKIFLGRDHYDWSWLDPVMHEMRRLGIVPIIDLLHFGLPDWLVDFQNPDWPRYFGEYAHRFAERYPWVRYYTPVNEIYVTALFSAAFGWWNERVVSDTGFVTNVKHCCRASINAMRSILDLRPDAIFVFSESTEYVHPGAPGLVEQAHFMNERRFLSLDLMFGHDVSAMMYRYLLASGMTSEEYLCFMKNKPHKSHSIRGPNYYTTNEPVPPPDARPIGPGAVYASYVTPRQYFERYRLPVMHTETNRTAK